MNALTGFLAASPFSDPKARRKEIEQAVESLRHSPLRCPVVVTKHGLPFRRLIVRERFFVYYIYTAPRGMTSGGTLSVRAVKHAASHDPFLNVREPLVSEQTPGTLSTRESTELSIV